MLSSLFGFGRLRFSTRISDLSDPAMHAQSSYLLERMFHRGHALAWDGKEVLQHLIAEHGRPSLPKEQRAALGRIFAIIMWGEMAAWRVGASLAGQLEPVSARLAATSQAYDEARHFYTMYDYLVALEGLPDKLDAHTERLLRTVLAAGSFAHQLMGMQLLVEPIALTLFQVVRQLRIEPVLSTLLPYFEKDEARHVALGVHLLPALIRKMSRTERAALWSFQLRLLGLVAASTAGLNRDLLVLGADAREATSLAGARILHLMEALKKQLAGDAYVPTRLLRRVGNLATEIIVPESDGVRGLLARLFSAAFTGGSIVAADSLPEPADADVPLLRRAVQKAAKGGDHSP